MISRRMFVLGAIALPVAVKAAALEGIVSIPAPRVYCWFKGHLFVAQGSTITWTHRDDIEKWT